jgi:hypothetical protein
LEHATVRVRLLRGREKLLEEDISAHNSVLQSSRKPINAVGQPLLLLQLWGGLIKSPTHMHVAAQAAHLRAEVGVLQVYCRYASMLLLNETGSPTSFIVEKAAGIFKQYPIVA